MEKAYIILTYIIYKTKNQYYQQKEQDIVFMFKNFLICIDFTIL